MAGAFIKVRIDDREIAQRLDLLRRLGQDLRAPFQPV